MLKVFVDSGSSIKQEEKEKYGVEIFPLNILLDEKEYLDGINLTNEEFYDFLINKKVFPKTSLPNLSEIQEKVENEVANKNQVIIVTISSKFSGTHNAISLLFKDNPNVRVIDSCMACGGIRLIIDEINRNRNLTLDEIVAKVEKFIPRIKTMAIPETLEYLFRGGRLSKKEWILGSILKIKPIIGFKNKGVHVYAKKIGIKNAMKYVAEALEKLDCDPNYDIIASYTYNKRNVDTLVAMTNEKFLPQIRVYDNLDHAVACHWGPNAFGYIFVGKE